MKEIIIKVIFSCAIFWPVFAHSQLVLDYFDPNVLRLARIVWDESLNTENEIWLDSINCSESRNVRNWSYVAIGVHLEDIGANINLTDSCFDAYGSEIITKLYSVKSGSNIDESLNSLIDYKELAESETEIHKQITVSSLFHEIMVIRKIKKTREDGIRLQELEKNKLNRYSLDINHKILLELAEKNKPELLDLFNMYSDNQKVQAYKALEFSEAFKTYRSIFIKDFKKYYLQDNFNTLSSDSKIILLGYWCFNLDLIKSSERNEIKKNLFIIDSISESDYVRLFKVMLKSLINKESKQEYQYNVKKLGNTNSQGQLKKANEENKNQSINNIDFKSDQRVEKSKNIIIRPESNVTIFQNSLIEEIQEYVNTNLRTELYLESDFFRNSTVINLRKAVEILGNEYLQNNENRIEQYKINQITKTLIDIGTLNCTNCYEEATNLIFSLGNLAIPVLKQELFSKNNIRAQFATQKLIALKNREIVNWIISVTKNSVDDEMKIRGRLILKIMKQYRSLPIANRGISKEESDLLVSELIDPFLSEN